MPSQPENVDKNGSTTSFNASDLILDSTQIPRIDLLQSDAAIAAAIKRAADSDGPGFFYIVNHGIDVSVFEAAIREGYGFFRSLQEQQASRKKPSNAASCESATNSDSANLLTETSSLERFGRWGVKGYTCPGVEGAYNKDGVADVRPDAEKESGKLNTRECYNFRFPELDNAEKHPYLAADYGEFFAKMQEKESTSLRSFFPASENLTAAQISDSARLFFAPNLWPSKNILPNFEPVLQKYFSETKQVADRMFRIFQAVIGQKIPHTNGMNTFNLARYGQEPADSKEFGISDHTDWEMFTLLFPSYFDAAEQRLCDAEGVHVVNANNDESTEEKLIFTGLEAWYRDRWISVPHVAGALILNQGEMLSRMTMVNGTCAHGANGISEVTTKTPQLKAPVHRVRANKTERERYSLVSFWGPDFDFAVPDARDGDNPNENYAILSGEYYLRRNAMI